MTLPLAALAACIAVLVVGVLAVRASKGHATAGLLLAVDAVLLLPILMILTLAVTRTSSVAQLNDPNASFDWWGLWVDLFFPVLFLVLGAGGMALLVAVALVVEACRREKAPDVGRRTVHWLMTLALTAFVCFLVVSRAPTA